jgi:glutathione peroxidase
MFQVLASALRRLLPTSAAALAATAAIAGDATSPLDFTLPANDGAPYALAQHRGQVVLLVNTASECGFTKQYAGLEELWKTYKDRGLVVIAVPANEFGRQEPGTDAEIAAFCSTKFQITFPILAKAVVKGDGITPLYAWLTTKSSKPGKIGWNFVKFLIGRDGQVIDRFSSMTSPSSSSLVTAIEAALAAPAPTATPTAP